MSKNFIDDMGLAQEKNPSAIDAQTMKVYGPGYDYSTLTTVLPRLEGEEDYTIMPRLKKLGVGAYRNGQRVQEKKETKE